MDQSSNSLNWFEIPMLDVDRAKAFYEKAFDFEMHVQEMSGMMMGFFPSDNMSGKVNGALVKSDMHKPSQEGSFVYLNANPDMAPVLARIEAAGGTITLPKTEIGGENGYMAFFIDSEGNQVGLHSME